MADVETHTPGEYGEPREFDPNFKGPIENRSCTDVICCILFVIAVVGLFIVAIIAFVHGNPQRVIYPTNSKGQVCGVDINTGRDKLVFFDLIACARMGPAVLTIGCPTPQVCVKQCPTKSWWWVTAAVKDRVERALPGKAGSPTQARKDMICLDGKDGNDPSYVKKSIAMLITDKECAPYTYPSTSMMGRCLPKIMSDAAGKAKIITGTNTTMTDGKNRTIDSDKLKEGSKFLSKFMAAYDVIQGILDDLVKSWYLILIGCIIAMLLSLLWIFLLRLIAGIMILITLLLFLGLFIFSTIYCFVKWNTLKKEAQKPEMKFTPNVSYYFQLEKTWLAMGIISAVILGVIVLILIFLRNRIRIAVELIREASKCIGYMMLTLLWPLGPFLMQMIVLSFCVLVGIFLQSMGSPEGIPADTYKQYTENLTGNGTSLQQLQADIKDKIPKCNPSDNQTGKLCQFLRYGSPEYVWAFQLFNLFMFLWLFNFVIALGQITLAGAFASYYWAFTKPKDIPATPILKSFCRAFRYHLGSLAFGALLIAIVQFIRIILEYIDNKVKGSENPVAKFIVKCMKCCFWCLEKFLKFINKNAYIMIAVYGENFCKSAKNAFFLIMRNIVRVFVVDKVTDFLLLVGKLVVVGLVGSLAYFFFDGTLASKSDTMAKIGPSAGDLKYYFVPVIIIIVASYLIASLFFSVYSMAVDTLFLCFLEDLERNDGSNERPYYMSKNLMDILGKKNEAALMKKEEEEKT